jgi:hypothetical protein
VTFAALNFSRISSKDCSFSFLVGNQYTSFQKLKKRTPVEKPMGPPYDQFWQVDFQGLGWRQKPLGYKTPAVYSGYAIFNLYFNNVKPLFSANLF